jgi:hypothetical protein
MKALMVALALTLGVMATGKASAECKDEIASLHAKAAAQQSLMGRQSLGATGTTDTATRAGYATAKSWIAKAIDVEPVSELECLNDLARARKALAAASQASPEEAQRQGPVQPVQPGGRESLGSVAK